MRVCIVGAGPTGAALAYLLARRGVDLTLLERETDFARVFRGEALMPGGVDAIRQMGLGDSFARLPQRTCERMEFYVEGTLFVTLAGPDVAGENRVHIVSQPSLLEMLVGAAGAFPNCTVERGANLRDLTRRPDGTMVLRVTGADAERTIECDLVIGADGRGSTVRTRTGLALEQLPFPFDVIWYALPLPPALRERMCFYAFASARGTVAMYPSWDDRLRLGWNVPQGGLGALRESRDAWLDTIAELVRPDFGDFIRAHRAEASAPTQLKVVFGRCATWTAPGVLLLGDAVHPMSPVRAQGINLALRDALVAANHLVPALATGDRAAVQAAAERVQPEREPEIVRSQALQRATAGPPAVVRTRWFRRFVHPVLDRLGVIERIFLRSERPMRHGTTTVRLEV